MSKIDKELDDRISQLFEKVGSSDQDWYDPHTLAQGDVWDYIECIHLTPEARREVKKLVLWYAKNAPKADDPVSDLVASGSEATTDAANPPSDPKRKANT